MLNVYADLFELHFYFLLLMLLLVLLCVELLAKAFEFYEVKSFT